MYPTGFNAMYHVPATPGYYAGAAAPSPSYSLSTMATPAVGSFMNYAGGGATIEPPERFVTSMSGGVIVDKDGAPAGRVPANSFVDLKDGSVYGADGKKISLPEGASVDFFDLPDIGSMSKAFNGAVEGGGAGTAPGKPGTTNHHGPNVLGQWGPGGTFDFSAGKGGGGHAGCDSHGSATQVGGASGKGSETVGATATGSGHGMPPTAAAVASMQQQLSQAIAQLNGMALGMTGPPMGTMVGGASGGGAMGALGGYGTIGMVPMRLEHSLNQLVHVLRDLVAAVQTTQGGGGKVEQTGKVDQSTSDSKDSSDSSDSTSTSTSGSGAGTTSTSTSTSDSGSGSDSSGSSDSTSTATET